MLIDDSIKVIKGIGPSKTKLLNRLKIYTVEDLLYYFPKAYKDKSKLSLVNDCMIGEFCTVKANIIEKPVESRTKSGLLITKAILADSTGRINAIWYNNKFIKNMFLGCSEIILYGKINKYLSDVIIESPEIYKCGEKENINLFRIVPEYILTEGLTSKDIRKYVYEVLEKTQGMVQDIFSEEIRKQFGLAEVNFCIRNIHFPQSYDNLQLAQYRFKFEELFVVQYGLSQLKNMNHVKQGISFKSRGEIKKVINNLPFKLTKSQSNVLDEVFNDMKSDKTMNRLIQGDVGSGKTIIAILALLLCVKNGYQGLIMVPTEILAVQHFKYFCEVLENKNVKMEMLKGNMSVKNKQIILSQLNQGEIDILIGTHAIIEDNVKFLNLGLVITDEQHRFGVRQRALLSEKGENPDVLVMTATPIPRTLTLILYGDLDISIIDEKPLGRKKIETYHIDSSKKERLFGFVKNQLNDGRQAYVVCPLVEESEKLDLKSVVEYYEVLKNEHFQNYKVDLLHGKMKSSDKDNIMENFRNGLTQILISTTVIEVGVNVPNATIMIIENAERFGLAQLHQLRGRVGRGEYQSYCILISDSQGSVAKERLSFLTKSDNGFEIADKDLQLRGGGEILGLKQHGLAEFKIADIYNDIDIVKTSREAVNLFLNYGFVDVESNKRMLIEINKRLNKMLELIALN